MKGVLCCLAVLILTGVSPAQARNRQQGTIVRMRMSECLGASRGFVAAMSGQRPEPGQLCPEYVLVTDRVVYVISGRNSGQLLPLAEVTRFRFLKNEIMIRVDDAEKESRFVVKAMIMRPEWERQQMLEEAEASAMLSRHLDPTAIREQQ